MKPGDKVQFIAEKCSAVIIKVLSPQQLLIEDEDGFQYEVAKSEVMPIAIQDWSNDQFVSAFVSKESENEMPISKYLKRVWKVNNGVAQIDLHFHELTERNNEVSGDKQVFQLRVFREALEQVQLAQARELIVIHGVGEGVLRSAVVKHLKRTTTFEFMDADYKTYGFGAIRIFIR